MKIEKIKKDNKYKIIIGAMGILLVVSAIINVVTRAKYQTIDSIQLASGTVSLSKYDLQIIAMYQESDTGTIIGTNGKTYVELGNNDRMPNGNNYKISTNSYCYIDSKDNHDTEVELTTIDGHHVIENLKKNEKCYLYFDNLPLAQRLIATANKTIIITSAGFGAVDTNQGGLYEFEGITAGSKTQFYRGAVTNNYVKLGTNGNETYWRIVRFDEEGNIRLIYDGTSAHDNGQQSDDRQLTTNFNGTSMYTTMYHSRSAETSVKWSNSEIKTYLEGTWLTIFENKLSAKEKGQLTTGKFCSDISGNANSYGARTRLETNKTPSFSCNSGDITISKVGMLSADEYSFAGGGGHGQVNISFYLYTGKSWWTLSPYYWDSSYSGDAGVYHVEASGSLAYANASGTHGIRPIITLKGNTLFNSATNGTKDNPYTIV